MYDRDTGRPRGFAFADMANDGDAQSAIDALEKDHKFLLEGGVFTQDLIDMWISYKRENEVDPVRLRTTPLEYELYYDA